MAGWHLRLWRRVKVAPGLTVNLSKSGPSLSVGPRGSKITFGQRGVRQTIGLPGTGLYMSRQLSSGQARTAAPAAEPRFPEPPAIEPADTAAVAAVEPAAAGQPVEIHYGLPLVVAVVVWIALGASGNENAVAVAGGILAFAVGILYEIFAAHHPTAAKVLAQVAIAIVAVASIVVAFVAVLGVLVLGTGMRNRRR